MKKRLSMLLMLICCAFALTACGAVENKTVIDINDTADVMKIQNSAEGIYQEYAPVANNPGLLDRYEAYNDDELELASQILESKGLKIDGKAFVSGMESYLNALDELGEVTSVTGIGEPSTWDVKEDQVIVAYGLTGTSHNGSIEIIFDKNLHVKSATTNIDYSLEELMAKAGINTAMGMGTVFVMLIVISLIISLFQFIPKIQKALEKKNTDNKVDDSVDNAIADIIEREESEEDDLELIAVIAAAIAASEGASSTDGFVVRSIKRIR